MKNVDARKEPVLKQKQMITCKSARYVDWEPFMEEMQANWKVETLKRRVRALEAKHRELGFECEPQKEQSRLNDVRRAAALRDEHVP